MATESLQNIMFASGKLSIDPTGDPTSAFPHGGTSLGYVLNVIVQPTQISRQITAEELGAITVEVIDAGRAWIFGCTLRGWDNDAYSTLFPGTATGSSSGRTGIKDTTSTSRAGSKLTDNSVKLVYTPDDTDRHPMIVLYKAIPLLDETAEMMFELSDELMVPALFLAMPDSSGNIYAQELPEDISFT